jgi:hypothetical protein
MKETFMKLNKLFLSGTLVILLCPPAVTAQEKAAEKLGQVDFPVSCTAAAQKQFDQALAALHSFWYEEALRLFTGVAETDPSCAMAYWGVAHEHLLSSLAATESADIAEREQCNRKGEVDRRQNRS